MTVKVNNFTCLITVGKECREVKATVYLDEPVDPEDLEEIHFLNT